MKKTEKKKTGKKKAAGEKSNKSASKQMNRDFNKKMKTLVRDIKKETQTTIKNVLKDAKRKLNEGSEFVMNDVLNSIATTVESAEKAVSDTKKTKVGKKIIKALNLEEKSEMEAPAPKAPVKTTTRKVGTRAAGQKTGTTTTAAKKPVTKRARSVEPSPDEPAGTTRTNDSTNTAQN